MSQDHVQFLRSKMQTLIHTFIDKEDHEDIQAAIKSTADMESRRMQLNELLVYHSLIVHARSWCSEDEKEIMAATRRLSIAEAQELLSEYIAEMNKDRAGKRLYRRRASHNVFEEEQGVEEITL